MSSNIDWSAKINAKVEAHLNEELSDKQKKYQEFFKKALEKFGVGSPDELDTEKKKELFNYVDSNWKGAGEVKEGLVDKIKDQLANLKKKKQDGNSEMDDATIMKLASLLQKKGQLAQKAEQHMQAAQQAGEDGDDEREDDEQDKWQEVQHQIEAIDDEIRILKAKDKESRERG